MSIGNMHMLLGNCGFVPKYTLVFSATEVTEGTSFNVTLNSDSVPDNTTVGYTITGVNAADISLGSLTGTFTIQSDSNTVTVGTNTNDDTIMFLLADTGASGGGRVLKYLMNNDLTSTTFDSSYTHSHSFASGMFFKTDGEHLWIQTPTDDNFNEYTLTDAPDTNQWDLSTISGPTSASYGTTGSNHQGMWISDDGSDLFQTDRDAQIIMQDGISTWDPLSPGSPGRTLDISSDTNLPTGIHVKSDGTKAFVADLASPIVGATGAIIEYSGTAFQCNTWTKGDTLSLSYNATDVFLYPGGTKMYITELDAKVHYYTLSTAWDLSTASFVRTLDLSATYNEIYGIYVVTPPSETFRITLDAVDSLNNPTLSKTGTVRINDP
jgi:hypothetical protein